MNLALVYFDIATQEETAFVETHSAESLRVFFEDRCRDFLAWAEQELAHRDSRDRSLAALAFPHPTFRTGQRELAETVYKGVAAGRCVMAQAPTGIGKTVGTVFAMLKAAKPYGLDKVFYLTAKSTGRRLALDAAVLMGISAPALSLRVLELTARDKACEHRDKACHGDSCPLAKGFYDRLPAARLESLESGLMDRAALRDVALKHQVCPYYLAQEVSRWADVIVGDYNYYFDGSAMLHAMTVGNEWRVGVLVDEAHNLVERARAMYSASLSQASLRAVRTAAPAGRPAGAGQGQSQLERAAQSADRAARDAGRAAERVHDRAQASQQRHGDPFRRSPARVRRRPAAAGLLRHPGFPAPRRILRVSLGSRMGG